MLQQRVRRICRFPPIRRRDLCRVRFVNKTPFNVELVQLTWRSSVHPILCSPHQLESGCHMDMDIYNKSSWIARKLTTKDDLYIDDKKVFVPKSTLETLNQSNLEDTSQRLELTITTPLRTLKQASMLCVKNFISNVNDVSALGLPRNLLGELEQLVKERTESQSKVMLDSYGT